MNKPSESDDHSTIGADGPITLNRPPGTSLPADDRGSGRIEAREPIFAPSAAPVLA